MILINVLQRLSAAVTRILAAPRPYKPEAALQAALTSLPEPSRTVYLLHARDQLSLSEIGQQLDLTPAEAQSYLASALVHLDRQIGTISPVGAVASDWADR